MVEIPWIETDQYIRSGHRSPEDFQPDSFRTIPLSEDEGIKAVVGKPKGSDKMEVQSYLFDKSKGWTLDKAKAWFEGHRETLVREHFTAIFPFQVLEKVVDKPLRIKGVAMKVGMSRNRNIYTPEELEAFASKLVGAPLYIEHVAVPNAIGRVTNAYFDGENLWYEAEIYDDEYAEKIRKGLIQHVSVGADYETIDILDGKVPHGLHNAELSLVAVPGIPETNIQILEKLNPANAPPIAEQSDVLPLQAGEYYLAYYRDPNAFLPQHFTATWLDKENGVLAVQGRLKDKPEETRVQAILFAREKWDEAKIQDWLRLHPQYIVEKAEPSAPKASEADTSKGLKEVVETSENKPKTLSTQLWERVWSTRYKNELPDDAFALILPGGEKDETGRTKPRSLRLFPYKNAQGKVDLPHLRNANARVSQMIDGKIPRGQATVDQLKQAQRKLVAVKKKLGIGAAAEEMKLYEEINAEEEVPEKIEPLPEPTSDEFLQSLEDALDEIWNAIEDLQGRIQKLEQTKPQIKGQDETGKDTITEQLTVKQQAKDPNLIDKRKILELIPPERVVRSWTYGPRQLVYQIRYLLSQSSNGQGVSQDELAETQKQSRSD
ncbi:MAG: hypothetical protein QXL91_05725 [Candidatus Bathyarchaeia archaeon]